jgi:sec-independent protein translocase protein TatA
MTPLIAFGPIGGGEWLIIGGIVFLLFGAKRLPELARSFGKAKNEFQKASREVTDEIERDTTQSSTSPNVNGTSKKN